MHFTVEQAMSIYPLSEGKLIAGSSGLKRVIKAINVMDAPDIADWIKEGEMLFTTAYLFKDCPEDAMELIRKLAKRRSAGLGIKLGRFWQSVPQAIVEQADKLDFPVIALPYAFTFSDQMNGLFQAEMKRSTVAMQDVMEKQVRLMRFALQPEPVGSLFEKVSLVIGVKLAVISAAGRVIYIGAELDEGELLNSSPWGPSKARFRYGGGQALRVPLMRAERCEGFVVFAHTGVYLSALEEGLYVQAAELIAFHLNRYEGGPLWPSPVMGDMELMIRRHLKNGLAAQTLVEYSKSAGMELLDKPYRCILTDVPEEPAGPRGRLEKLERLRAEMRAVPSLEELGGIHTVLEEGVLSLVPDDPSEEEGHMERLLRAGLFGISQDASLAGSRCSLSSRKIGVEALKEGFGECIDTLRLSRDWGIGDRVAAYGHLDLALVFEQVSRERMELYCNRWLGKLLEEKPDYAQEMLRTLEAYLDCDGHLNETAKRLFIHRNTVTYRMDKVGELLQVDLKKMGDQMRLKLAFLFRRMMAGGSSGADKAV